MSAMKEIATTAQAIGETAVQAMQDECRGDGAAVYAALQVIVGYAALLGYQPAPEEEDAHESLFG